MDNVLTLCLLFLQLFTIAYCQRVAPGVPPQQYQQPPPPNAQYQQVPQQQHYQQVPVQHQQHQVPQQQHYQQPVHPPQQAHGIPQGHHDQGHPQQLLNTANIAHEKQHIQEHLDVPIDTSKMSEQELQFHYFKMHDADNNNKLDGCELIKSLIHWHAESELGDKNDVRIQTDTDLEAMVDPILKEMDVNNDGFVDYTEFRSSTDK